MTDSDYSGVNLGGRWMRRTGWSLFSGGILVALVGLAIPGAIGLVVLLYAIVLTVSGS